MMRKHMQLHARRRVLLLGLGTFATSALGSRGALAASRWPDNSAPRAEGAEPVESLRAVFYEKHRAASGGKRHAGVVRWTRDAQVDAAHMLETAIKASIAIPDLDLGATWTVRRNLDKYLPASHTIDVQFKLPPESPYGIGSIDDVVMKTGERAVGAPLKGVIVKVVSGYFLVGLSAQEAERDANVALLRDRDWIDLALVLDSGRRANLTFDKGEAGRRVFSEVFAAWTGPPRPARPEDVGDVGPQRGVIK